MAVAIETYQRKTPSSFPTINPQNADGFVKLTELSIIIKSPAVVHHNHQYGFIIKNMMPPQIGCREYILGFELSDEVSLSESFEDKKVVSILSRLISSNIRNPK